jgi:hypothetical protein
MILYIFNQITSKCLDLFQTSKINNGIKMFIIGNFMYKMYSDFFKSFEMIDRKHLKLLDDNEGSMNLFKLLTSCLVGITLIGCASKPIPPTPLNKNFYDDKNSKISVVVTSPEKVDTYLFGADCLLCYAAASAANSSLTSHMQTLPTTDFTNVKTEILKVLQDKGKIAEISTASLNLEKLKSFKTKENGFADVDYRVLKDVLKTDKLLLVQISRLGASRSYASYVPTGAPVGSVAGKILIVDLNTNKLELYMPINVDMSVQGEWDEPKNFPGVTNAYYQAIEMAKKFVLTQLK